MTAFADPIELNYDELLNAIYRLQVDLKILTEQLARERNHGMADMLLHSLAYVSHVMQSAQPSLRRH